MDAAEVYLSRHLDGMIFRVQPESEPMGTGVVDFCITPKVSTSVGETSNREGESSRPSPA